VRIGFSEAEMRKPIVLGLVCWALLTGYLLGEVVRAQVSITGGQGPGIATVRTTVGSASAYGSVSVGTSATSVRSSTATRTSVTLQNNSANSVYCGTNSSVVAGGAGTASSGIVLGSGSPGGAYTWDRYTGDIYCIASGSASDVRYWESTTQ